MSETEKKSLDDKPHYSSEEYRQLLQNASSRQIAAQLGQWREMYINEELPKIYSETGLNHKHKVQITSPFRNEKNPSFSLTTKEGGNDFAFNDFGGSGLSGGGAVQYRYIQMFGHQPTKDDEERFIIDEALQRSYPQILTFGSTDEYGNRKVYVDPVFEHRQKQAKMLEFMADNGFLSLVTPKGFPERDYVKKVEFHLDKIQQVFPDTAQLQSTLKSILNGEEFEKTQYSEAANNALSYALTQVVLNAKSNAHLAVFTEDMKLNNLYNAVNGMIELPLHRFDKRLSPLNFEPYIRDKTHYSIGDKEYHKRFENDVNRHKDLNNLDVGEILVTNDPLHYRDMLNEHRPVALIPKGYYDQHYNNPKFLLNIDANNGKEKTAHLPLTFAMGKIFDNGSVGKVQLDIYASTLNPLELNKTLSTIKLGNHQFNQEQLNQIAQTKQFCDWYAVSLAQMPKDKSLTAYRFNSRVDDDLATLATRFYPITQPEMDNQKFRFTAFMNKIAQRAENLAAERLELSSQLANADKKNEKRLTSLGASRQYPSVAENVQNTVFSIRSSSEMLAKMFDKPSRAIEQQKIWNFFADKVESVPERAEHYVGKKPNYSPMHHTYLKANELTNNMLVQNRNTPEYAKFIQERYLDKKDSQGIAIDAKFGLGFGRGDEFNLAFKEVTGRNLYSANDNKQGHGQYFSSKENRIKGMLIERITFPVRDEYGQVVAFGARKTKDDDSAKYINSKTPDDMMAVFNKNLVFYGLYESKSAIQQKNEIIITEGYMDCISNHIAGIENAVATMGTALPAEKLHKALQYADNVKIVLDGDRAGLKAMDQTILNNVFRKQENQSLVYSPNQRISFVNLPSGLDPDEHINQYGVDDYKKRLEQAIPAEDYAIVGTYRSVFLVTKNHEPLSIEEQLRRQSDPIYQAKFKQSLNELLEDVKVAYPDVANKILQKADDLINGFNAVKGMSINDEIGKNVQDLGMIFIRPKNNEFDDPMKQLLFPSVAKMLQEQSLQEKLIVPTVKVEMEETPQLTMIEEALKQQEYIKEPTNEQKLVKQSSMKISM